MSGQVGSTVYVGIHICDLVDMLAKESEEEFPNLLKPINKK